MIKTFIYEYENNKFPYVYQKTEDFITVIAISKYFAGKNLDDYGVWCYNLSLKDAYNNIDTENLSIKEIEKKLQENIHHFSFIDQKYNTSGYSVRGTLQDCIEDFKGIKELAIIPSLISQCENNMYIFK